MAHAAFLLALSGEAVDCRVGFHSAFISPDFYCGQLVLSEPLTI
jgi:hypothetical protein